MSVESDELSAADPMQKSDAGLVEPPATEPVQKPDADGLVEAVVVKGTVRWGPGPWTTTLKDPTLCWTAGPEETVRLPAAEVTRLVASGVLRYRGDPAPLEQTASAESGAWRPGRVINAHADGGDNNPAGIGYRGQR